MVIKKDLPKLLQIAKNIKIEVEYKGQKTPCRSCGSMEHFSGRCPAPVCYICRLPGHKGPECARAKTCHKCGMKGHLQRSCRPKPINDAVISNVHNTREVPKKDTEEKVGNKQKDNEPVQGITNKPTQSVPEDGEVVSDESDESSEEEMQLEENVKSKKRPLDDSSTLSAPNNQSTPNKKGKKKKKKKK